MRPTSESVCSLYVKIRSSGIVVDLDRICVAGIGRQGVESFNRRYVVINVSLNGWSAEIDRSAPNGVVDTFTVRVDILRAGMSRHSMVREEVVVLFDGVSGA